MGKGLILQVPGGETNVLLHACCAPCSGAIIEIMLQQGIRPTVFYSNANIFPLEEYEIRRNECRRYCEANGLDFIDDDYDHKDWQRIAKGYRPPGNIYPHAIRHICQENLLHRPILSVLYV